MQDYLYHFDMIEYAVCHTECEIANYEAFKRKLSTERQNMILDGYWKRELVHNKRMLKFWLKVGSVFDKYAEHQVNKSILYSAVIIRKMFEDEKAAETVLKNGNLPMPLLRLLNYKVKITAYPFSGDADLITERVIPDNYDYSKVYLEEVELNKERKYAVVLGNEVKGVQQAVVDICDGCIELPQFGTKHSLNVSVTAGIVIWDFFKQLY